MKARTYARLALLIPLLIWVIVLLIQMLIILFRPVDVYSNGTDTDTLFGLVEMVLSFYMIGILFWFLPYLVLSIALLIISFNSQLDVLKYMFVLSPFAMAILVMMEMTILSLATGVVLSPADIVSNIATSAGINLFVGIFALVCGYICVGLGFGGYLLLQYFGLIKQAETISSEVLPATS